ncbi:unnamed protein product [Peniophora sp. CBMAI 1063]|nr:unnamed protein product [Peniophora sp. CBMAI 1063]
MSIRLTVVVAATPTHGIGKSGGLPWRLPREMKYFARVTTSAPENRKNAVIMGRNTWESIPLRFRPLLNRTNVVLTSKLAYTLGVEGDATTRNDLPSALSEISQGPMPIHRYFIIGGAGLYDETLALPTSSSVYVDRVLLTRVLEPNFDCDTFVHSLGSMSGDGQEGWRRATQEELRQWAQFDVPEGVQEEKGVRYEFQMWVRD